MRSPSTTGPEQMPSSGQSLTRPPASLSCATCQRNLPSLSRKHIRTPLSPLISLSRGRLLLVPMKILPPEKIGPPYALLPRYCDHRTFLSLETSQSVGMFFSTRLTRLRCTVPPQTGQL